MSKPAKPWTQCVIQLPTDQQTVWIKLWPWYAAPFQAVADMQDGQFIAVLPYIDFNGDPQQTQLNIAIAQVYAWRAL